ncbi:MAG: hypothetical protein ACTSQG_10330 [Promethearchaeota archaeon]
MEIKKLKLKDLKPAPYNPRTISDDEYRKLKNSPEVWLCRTYHL